MNPEGLLENSGGRGLPAKLPAGERVLWQGSPSWKSLASRVFHIRIVAAYFALIVAWCVASTLRAGLPAEAVALSSAKLLGVSLVPIALIALYCWGLQRSTVYTITGRRVVMSFGIALPMTINLPFSRIAAAGLKRRADGSGDIPLRLLDGERMTYFVVWPHARPWRLARPEPMLRCIPQVEAAAAILARALATHAAVTNSAQPASSARSEVVPAVHSPHAQAA